MIVKKTSIFPAPKETVFQKLQQLETLQYIAWPYATFKPVGKAVPIWTVGSTSAYRFRLFGLIPFGTHTIHIVRFDPDGVSSREGNEHVPVWNHDIRLIEKDENHTQYTSGRDSCRLEDRSCMDVGECLLYAQAEKVDPTAKKKEKKYRKENAAGGKCT